MNLNSLTVHMMLNLSARWLEDEGFCAALKQSGPLGQGILAQLEQAHEPLAELQNRRAAAQAELRALIDEAGALDQLHDRKARALHHHLRGLIAGSDEPKEVERYHELEGLLFPNGLRVVNLPYIEEGGASVALERAVDGQTRAKLASIVVGDQSLDDLLDAWLDAGRRLGESVRARAELKASLSRDGSAVDAIDVKAGRTQWIQAVRGLLWSLEVSEELGELAEGVVAAIEEAIEVALRRRLDEEADEDGQSGGEESPEDEVGGGSGTPA